MILRTTDFPTDRQAHINDHRVLHKHENNIVWASDHGDDGSAIQSAIDEAENIGAGLVYIPAGDWNVNHTIRCARGVDVKAARGAVLRAQVNEDLIHLNRDMWWSGGKLFCRGVENYTAAAMSLFGRDEYIWWNGISGISDVLIQNDRNEPTGLGLRLRADEGYVHGCFFQTIVIQGFERGVSVESPLPKDAERHAINGHSYVSLNLSHCKKAIWFEGQKEAAYATGHCFQNVSFENIKEHQILLEGMTGRNAFTNVVEYDVQADSPGIELGPDTFRNRIVIFTKLTPEQIVDKGTNNIITTL